MRYENGSSPSTCVTQETREFNAIFIHSALDDSGLTAAEFRVYAHLSRRAGANGAYPSLSSIARVCRLSRHTVINALNVLWGRGMIEIKHTHGKANLYFLTPPSLWKLTSANKAPVQSEHGTSANGALPPVQSRHTKDIHIRKSIEGDSLSPEKFIEQWNSIAPTKILNFGDKRMKAFNARLSDQFFLDNYETALGKIPKSSFLMGSSDRGWRANITWFLRPDSVTELMEGKYDDKDSKPKKVFYGPL